jgi:ubiquitin-conjugating enzyme E2 D/E
MSSTASLRRLINEKKTLEKLQSDSSSQESSMFKVKCEDDDMYSWTAEIYGPPESYYQGYSFKLSIKLTQEYPSKAPIVKFLTKIEHVNISARGNICLDILKDNWSPSLTIRSILISIVSLLDKPNVEDPLNPELAILCKNDLKEYKKKIRNACKKHATKIEKDD